MQIRDTGDTLSDFVVDDCSLDDEYYDFHFSLHSAVYEQLRRPARFTGETATAARTIRQAAIAMVF